MMEKCNVSLLLRPRTLTTLRRDGSRSSNDKVRPEGLWVRGPAARHAHTVTWGRAAPDGHTSLAIIGRCCQVLENVCGSQCLSQNMNRYYGASLNTATFLLARASTRQTSPSLTGLLQSNLKREKKKTPHPTPFLYHFSLFHSLS